MGRGKYMEIHTCTHRIQVCCSYLHSPACTKKIQKKTPCIHKDYSEITQKSTFELEINLTFGTLTQPTPVVPTHHPIPPFQPNHPPAIHRSTPRGDFRRAVKSLARQGRLEESELRRSAFVGRTSRRGRPWETVR